MEIEVWSVGQLTQRVKELLEGEIGRVWVEGEISAWKLHPTSGHAYFVLKDEDAVVKCVIWASTLRRIRVKPANGLLVRILGTLSVYESRGEYQLYVDRIQLAGEGALQAAFFELRARLEAEGLFDPARKKPLPVFPSRIGLVTSRSGAALFDILHVLEARWPLARVYLWPAAVQGVEAAPEIAEGVAQMDRIGLDLLIVGRGGGSLEDLWAFNEEIVARAIAGCRTPVVSAVGHEVDFTIADFVADARAATPSHAAEMVTPDRAQVQQRLRRDHRAMVQALQRQLERSRHRLERARVSRGLGRAEGLLQRKRLDLDRLGDRLQAGLTGRVRRDRIRLERMRERLQRRRPDVLLLAARGRLDVAGARLQALGPLQVLARGYGIARGFDGRILRGAEDASVGEAVSVTLHRGILECRVEQRTLKGEDG